MGECGEKQTIVTSSFSHKIPVSTMRWEYKYPRETLGWLYLADGATVVAFL